MKPHIPKNTIFSFHSPPFFFFRLSSLIIHPFLSDAKTTTNRTTARIMYSVKSSLSVGWGGEGGEGTAKMCTGVRQESTPTGERLNVTRQRGGKEEKQMPEGEEIKKRGGGKQKRKIQFVSYKSPIRGIKVLKWRITMNNL